MNSLKSLLLAVLLISATLFNGKAQNGVALVLSGGGAKGFAHIGVLKVLDSLHVPVDYIGGTSMGAIIGSLYALGYSGKEIEQMAKATNWMELFSDEPNRDLIPFFEKHMMERYIASIKINENGIKLPEGFISGQRILNFLSEITIDAHSYKDFTQFKIPFFCVATDLGIGKDVVLDKGFITTALRSSMSIPTAFSPFELNNRLMIDGGIINNFPVDVMRERYTGTIIGVDIQKGMMPRQKLESFTNVLNQLSTIIDLNRYNSNISRCDIYIHPDINGFSTMSFDAEAVDTLIKRGEKAARELIPELVKHSCSELDSNYNHSRDVAIRQNSIFTVKEIIVRGQKRNSPLYIKQKLGIEAGKPFTLEYLKYGINSLYATNEYEYISYRFVEPDVLEIFCKERIIHSINIGINYQSGTSASVLMNYTYKNMLFNGDVFYVDAKLSESPGLKACYVLDKGGIPAPQVKFQYNHMAFNFYDDGKRTGNAQLNFGTLEAGVNSTGFNLFTLGLASNIEFYDYYDIVFSSKNIPPLTKSVTKFFYNYKIYAIYDSRNSSVLPVKGNRFYAALKLYTDNFITYENNVPAVSVMMKDDGALKLSKRFTLLHDFATRFFITDSLPSPLIQTFVGGDSQPDLYEYHMPLLGLRFMEIMTKDVVTYTTGLRYNTYKKTYLSLLGNVGIASNKLFIRDINKSNRYIAGAGINYTYYSILGPMQYTISYSNISKTFVQYISLGFRF